MYAADRRRRAGGRARARAVARATCEMSRPALCQVGCGGPGPRSSRRSVASVRSLPLIAAAMLLGGPRRVGDLGGRAGLDAAGRRAPCCARSPSAPDRFARRPASWRRSRCAARRAGARGMRRSRALRGARAAGGRTVSVRCGGLVATYQHLGGVAVAARAGRHGGRADRPCRDAPGLGPHVHLGARVAATGRTATRSPCSRAGRAGRSRRCRPARRAPPAGPGARRRGRWDRRRPPACARAVRRLPGAAARRSRVPRVVRPRRDRTGCRGRCGSGSRSSPSGCRSAAGWSSCGAAGARVGAERRPARPPRLARDAVGACQHPVAAGFEPAAPAPARTVAARDAQVASAADELLRHDADLLRQRGAASGARVLHDRRRRDGAPHAPARGGRLLSHRHRRARRAGRAGGGARGRHAAGARRPQRAALRRARPAAERLQRLLHPHERPAAHGQGAGDPQPDPRQRPRLRGRLRGLVLPALRGLQDRCRGRRRQPLPDPQDAADAREGGQLLLSPVGLPGRPAQAARRAAGLRHAAPPLQRGALVHRVGPAGRLAEPLDVHLGRAGAVGREARLLRLVRRAAELLHGAVLRDARARTSPTASGRRSFTSSARTS